MKGGGKRVNQKNFTLMLLVASSSTARREKFLKYLPYKQSDALNFLPVI